MPRYTTTGYVLDEAEKLVAERLVEGGEFADRPADGVGFRILGVIDVHRRGGFWWQLVFAEVAPGLTGYR